MNNLVTIQWSSSKMSSFCIVSGFFRGKFDGGWWLRSTKSSIEWGYLLRKVLYRCSSMFGWYHLYFSILVGNCEQSDKISPVISLLSIQCDHLPHHSSPVIIKSENISIKLFLLFESDSTEKYKQQWELKIGKYFNILN